MKKGLRLRRFIKRQGTRHLKPCPDEEGIKTFRRSEYLLGLPLKPCPDEEGIKTIPVIAL